MHDRLLDLICCPACRRFPLELTAITTATAAPIAGDGATTQVVETGYLFCPNCQRFYFILDGIPRLITEEFAELIDLRLVRQQPEVFAPQAAALADFVARLEQRRPTSATAAWEMEDVAFWESQVYADEKQQQAYLERVQRSRPEAGNRTYPREKYLFRYLRPQVKGRVLLDIGCGVSQTIRVLCDPSQVGYYYVGADLSLSALKVNRRTMPGDFVQCSADQLPFRDGCAAGIVLLGVLHHLANQEATLRRLMSLLEPGGMLALHEVAQRSRATPRWRWLRRSSDQESRHNDAVNRDVVVGLLREQGDILSLKHEYSRLRDVLARRLDEPMRTRPWLTRVVLGLDDVFLATVGRSSSLLGSRAILVLARKRQAQSSQPPS